MKPYPIIHSSLLLLILFNISVSYSQDQLDHKKGYFVDSSDHIYWQAEKPVYLFISENEDGSNAVRLKTVQNKKMLASANPLYFEGHGVHYIRHLDLHPNETVNFDVNADGIAPTTAIEFLNAPKYVTRGKVFYGKGLNLKATAKDEMAGVNKIYQSVDKTDFTAYTSDIPLEQDKAYEVKFYAVDNVGNIEEPNIKQFTVDITPPTTSHQISGDQLDNILGPSAMISLSSSDKASGVDQIKYSIDGGPEKTYSHEISLRYLGDGDHTIKYYAIDNVLNSEKSIEFKFYLDREPALAHAIIKGDKCEAHGKTYISERTELELKADDNKSGVQKIVYSIDGEHSRAYNKPFHLEKKSGHHTIHFHAVDVVNNSYKSEHKEEYQGHQQIELDVAPPSLKYGFKNKKYFSRDTMFITSDTDIILNASDNEAGVAEIGYKIDGKENVKYDPNKPIHIHKEGCHQIDFYGIDGVNNMKSDAFFVKVDDHGPKNEHAFSSTSIGKIMLYEKDQSIEVYPKGTILFLSATDESSGLKGIYFKIDEQPEVKYGTPIRLTKKGLRTITIRSVDPLGNETIAQNLEFFIK